MSETAAEQVARLRPEEFMGCLAVLIPPPQVRQR